MVPIPISFSHLWGDRGDPRGGTPPGYGTNHFVGSKSHPLRHQGQIAFTVQLVMQATLTLRHKTRHKHDNDSNAGISGFLSSAIANYRRARVILPTIASGSLDCTNKAASAPAGPPFAGTAPEGLQGI